MSLIYISFIFLIFLVIFLLFAFVLSARFLKSFISWIVKIFAGDGEECPFCHNKHSMLSFVTDKSHKKVCQKCGFSSEVDDDGVEKHS